MTTKKHGGARPNSGAKKTGKRKVWIPIAVTEDKIQEFTYAQTKKYLQEKADEL
jgi:hypothetical protein